MGNGFQQDKGVPTSSSLLESARRLTSNAAELAQCAKTSREHIASIRSQIEQIRNTAASAQRGCLQAHGDNRHGAAIGFEADSSDPALHDSQGHDPQGKAVILTALLVVFIGIISRASRR